MSVKFNISDLIQINHPEKSSQKSTQKSAEKHEEIVRKTSEKIVEKSAEKILDCMNDNPYIKQAFAKPNYFNFLL